MEEFERHGDACNDANPVLQIPNPAPTLVIAESSICSKEGYGNTLLLSRIIQSSCSSVAVASTVVSQTIEDGGVSISTNGSEQLQSSPRSTASIMQTSTSNFVTTSMPSSPEKFPVPQHLGNSAASSTTSSHQSTGEGSFPMICFPIPVESAAASRSASLKRGRNKVIVKEKACRRNSKTNSTSPSSSKNSMEAPIGLVLNDKGEEEYKVERIINKQLVNGIVQYRVKWEGWASKYNTWEPIENLSNCLDLVNDYNDGHQLNSKKKVPVQRDSGKSLKLRPTRNPRKDDSNRLARKPKSTRSPAINGNNGDITVNEHLDRQVTDPMIRRAWRQPEVPICVLGSSNILGNLVHLVRIKTEHDAENVMDDPYEGLNENNCVMAYAQTFNCHFPQLILNYYKAHTKFVADTDNSGNVNVQEATRSIEILRSCWTQEIHVNENKLFRGILQPTYATLTGDFAESHQSAASQEPDSIIKVRTGFSPLSHSSLTNNTASVSKFDKFGLPQSISTSDSEDASSRDDVTKNFMHKRNRPIKRRLFEEVEKNHGKKKLWMQELITPRKKQIQEKL